MSGTLLALAFAIILCALVYLIATSGDMPRLSSVPNYHATPISRPGG